jgi:hypothetical protein
MDYEDRNGFKPDGIWFFRRPDDDHSHLSTSETMRTAIEEPSTFGSCLFALEQMKRKSSPSSLGIDIESV